MARAERPTPGHVTIRGERYRARYARAPLYLVRDGVRRKIPFYVRPSLRVVLLCPAAVERGEVAECLEAARRCAEAADA